MKVKAVKVPNGHKDQCDTEGCRRKRRENRRFCNTCRQRLYRQRNPIMYRYDTLRYHARARGKGFELTFEQFKAFCERSDYHTDIGMESDSATIDRIDRHKPYRVDNIRVLTRAQNSDYRGSLNIELEPDTDGSQF